MGEVNCEEDYTEEMDRILDDILTEVEAPNKEVVIEWVKEYVPRDFDIDTADAWFNDYDTVKVFHDLILTN